MLTSLVPGTTTRDSFGIDPLFDPPLEGLAPWSHWPRTARRTCPAGWRGRGPLVRRDSRRAGAGQGVLRRLPARLACLAGALERREPWGVWGGEIFERGTIIARKRPRGRPRKHDPNRADEVAA